MKSIVELLFENQDIKYKNFHQKLMPTINKESVIGVRIPKIKEIIKIVRNEPFVKEFMQDLPHKYYEENNLHGGLLNSIQEEKEFFDFVEKFIPYIDNWATCDFTVSYLKSVKKYKKEFFERIKVWVKSNKPYVVRFAIVLLLTYYKDEFTKEIFDLVNSIKSKEYYVNMAIAWFYSVALVKNYDIAVKIIESKTLPTFIQNKSISKAVDSFRISDKNKEYLKTLRV